MQNFRYDFGRLDQARTGPVKERMAVDGVDAALFHGAQIRPGGIFREQV